MSMVAADSRRDDHPEHGRPKPKNLALDEQKDKTMLDDVEELNYLKNRSVLNLSELIYKHRQRQPQLIAMISPDVKHQLLTDPHFFKGLQQLERQDPINQRVKDVKKFILAMKQQTYDKHFFSQSKDLQRQARRLNPTSRSIVVEDKNTLAGELRAADESIRNKEAELTLSVGNSREHSERIVGTTQDSKTRSPLSNTSNSGGFFPFSKESPRGSAAMDENGQATFMIPNGDKKMQLVESQDINFLKKNANYSSD